MKVFILTEGGRGIGFGHIARCTALYEAFLEKGIRPYFIANADNSVKALLMGKRNKIFNWLKKQDELFDLISSADIIILDSYLAENNLYKKIAERTKLAVYIDDNKRINHPEGIVVNGAIYAKKLGYSNVNGIAYLLGTRYLALRKEFWDAPKKKIRKRINTIVITFGGDDVRDMTSKILKMLAVKYQYLSKKVIVGDGFANVNKIKKAVDANTELIYGPDAKKMKNIMLESDIAISAGGQTLYELTRLGVPVITVQIADNQDHNIRSFNRAGMVKYAGRWDDANILSGIEKCIEAVKDKAVRAIMSRRSALTIDGKGARRVITFLLKNMKN